MRHLGDEDLLRLELEGGDAEQLGHLAECAECDARRHLLRADLARLRELDGVRLEEPAPALPLPGRRAGRPRWLKAAAVLAAAFLGGGTGARYLVAEDARILPYVAPAALLQRDLAFHSCPVGDFEVRLDTLRAGTRP